MLCYKDRTYCTFYKECEYGEDCIRALTEKVQKDAEKWWESYESKDQVPVSIFADKPDCFISKDK
jgi:hypothetical protein